MRSWRNDIQSLVKKFQILALYFFPGVECLTRGGTEFTLAAALPGKEGELHTFDTRQARRPL
jgi:hypothetical protein